MKSQTPTTDRGSVKLNCEVDKRCQCVILPYTRLDKKNPMFVKTHTIKYIEQSNRGIYHDKHGISIILKSR